MSADWQPYVERWTTAGVLDSAAAERIRLWEREHSEPQGLRWPVVAALAFGAALLSAGILLFISAHWDEISPLQRMILVVSVIGAFHVGGAFAAERFEALSVALHTIGTVALGGGIALAGQTFHLSTHWPGAIMLWAAGAAVGWGLLRHWTQGVLTAILTPAWILCEWSYQRAMRGMPTELPILLALCGLCFVYLAARRSPADSAVRKGLGWLGGLALLPTVLAISINFRWGTWTPVDTVSIAAILILLGAVALAACARGRASFGLGLALVWTLLWPTLVVDRGENLMAYVWCAVGAVGLVGWGLQAARPERINLGMAGFAITLLAFYFSSVMDKLGRSASLIGLGVLFLAGGWLLERTRRQFMSKIRLEAV